MMMITHSKISHLVASLPTSRQQIWNKLLTTCNNLVDIGGLVAKLFQQLIYSHDITIFLQLCVVYIVTFLLYDHIRLVTTWFPNLLQQLGTSSANTTCRQLVKRFVTTCLQTCNNLYLFTCVVWHQLFR